jgi:hypothetical protein
MGTADVTTLFSVGVLLLGTMSISEKAEAASAMTTKKAPASADVICSYAPSQSNVVSHLAAATGGSAAAAALIAQAAGLTAVAHSSGGIIFTGAGGYVSGTLGAAAALPAIVTVGVVVGGSAATLELVCVNRNHPELVKKVRTAATEFMSRSRTLAATTSERTAARVQPFMAEFRGIAARARADGFEYANRASAQLGEAIRDKVK